MTDFAVIEFAYPKNNPENPYSVGLIIIWDGFIIQEFHSFINLSDPSDKNIPESIKKRCEFAPSFGLIERTIGELVLNLPLITHDGSIARKVFENEHFKLNISIPYGVANIIETYPMTGVSLKDSCDLHGIPLINQNDSLDNAKACARLFLKLKEE